MLEPSHHAEGPAPFDPNLAAHELPRAVLLDLWRRTVVAHAHLRQTWFDAVAAHYDAGVATELARGGWPGIARGDDDRQLFVDDLRFIIAATALKPDMLTVAGIEQAPIPAELLPGSAVFRALGGLGRKANAKKRAAAKAPAWVGAPGKLRAHIRGTSIEAGFAFLLSRWQRSESERSATVDLDALERAMESELDEKALALLWNLSALAYMLATDRWYTQVRRRYGAQMARKLEKEVWIDRGAAEYDLDIGLAAAGNRGGDVEALLAGFQFAPGEVGILDVDFELKSKNHGILTHKTCPAADRMEHFDGDRLEHCCEICVIGMPISGEMVNPKIQCRALKLPPRRDANDIACRWEYTLEEES